MDLPTNTLNEASPIRSKLVCVALNDRAQFESLRAQFHRAPHHKPPTQPVLYYKPRNTWSNDGARVEIPDGKSLVVGASVGVVIGKTCCRVTPEIALDYVGAYCLVHDFSLPEKSYYRPDIKGKCLDGSAPVGAAKQVDDPSRLSLRLQVNGEPRAALAVSSLCRGIEELISQISHIMTLQAGETIAVGFNGERVALQAGDEVMTACDGLATLRNTVGQEP